MRLGKYDLLDEIGRGGMGVVYRGFDPVLQRTVAVKTIQGGSSSEFATRLLTEARASAHLKHPGIVDIYDFDRDGDTLYIVMEFLEGESLRSALRNKSLDTRKLLAIFRVVAEALDFAHSRGVVHRDMKPSNIMVLPNGAPKLMDFGIAQVQSDERQTAPGSILGTPQYMSPEQIRGGTVTGQADQFALAIIAYEALTGRGPFDADSFTTVLYRITSAEFRDASAVNPALPVAVDAVLRKALAVKPDDRYPSCVEMISRLDQALGPTLSLPRIAPAPAQAPAYTARLEHAPVAPPSPMRPPPPGMPAVTMLAQAAPPSFVEAFPKTGFFSGEQVRFSKIEESFRFFRDNLQKQYESLTRQADVVWKLWAACVGVGFLILATGLVILFLSHGDGTITKGVVTGAASVLVYYIQRLFQQREDHYRMAAEEKNSHLEYGNKWLLVIQTVDAIQDPGERKRQQARIAEALTEQLGRARADRRRTSAGRKKQKAQAG